MARLLLSSASAGVYHLPSPDPVQNLLINSVAGITPTSGECPVIILCCLSSGSDSWLETCNQTLRLISLCIHELYMIAFGRKHGRARMCVVPAGDCWRTSFWIVVSARRDPSIRPKVYVAHQLQRCALAADFT